MTSRAVGVCTWTFGDAPLRDVLGRAQRLGFDGVELAGDLERTSASEAKALARGHGLEVLSITPDDVDLAHPDGAVRAQGVDYYRRLLDFAAEVASPRVGCHGMVPRYAPLGTMEEERDGLTESLAAIGPEAAARGITLAFEALNRYESCHVNTATQALALRDRIGENGPTLLLDAYHMNLEEPDPVAALERAGDALGLYHAADSNREGLGRGHVDFVAQFEALDAIDYRGPIVLECTAPGPNPFRPIRSDADREVLEQHLATSLRWLETHGRWNRAR